MSSVMSSVMSSGVSLVSPQTVVTIEESPRSGGVSDSVSVGVAPSSAVTQPTTPSSAVGSVSGGTCGGLVSITMDESNTSMLPAYLEKAVDEATIKLAIDNTTAAAPVALIIHHEPTRPPVSSDTHHVPGAIAASIMDSKRLTVPVRQSSHNERKHSPNQMTIAIDDSKDIGNRISDTTSDGGLQPQSRGAITSLMLNVSNRDTSWCISRMASNVNGIGASDAEERLLEFGPNALVNLKLDQWYHHLGRAFAHPFNMLLLALAVVGAATEDYKSLVVLTTMVIVSVLTRFTQEWKSALAADDLRKRITQMVHVRRPINTNDVPADDATASSGGHGHGAPKHIPGQPYMLVNVPFENVVPGDVVELAAGSMIPGDIRVIESDNALVSQSVLTGESIPVEKVSVSWTALQIAPSSTTATPNATAITTSVPVAADEAAGLTSGDHLRRTNLAFMGSNVSAGSLVGLVVVTGNRTYFGTNAAQLVHARPPSSFAVGVKKISYLLMIFMLVMMPLIVIINGATTGEWVDAALFGVAVAVGLTPEMLPMIVNGNLALGAARMAREKCIIKRLEAIQNIGAMTVLCTDKTGTLTADQVEVHTSIDTYGEPSSLPLSTAYVISKYQKGLRNVMDESILRSGEAISSLVTLSTSYQKVTELPFDFVRRMMSVCVTGIQLPLPADVPQSPLPPMLLCKGAFDEVVAQCTRYVRTSSESSPTGGVALIGDAERAKLASLAISLPSSGLRIIAVAYKPFACGSNGEIKITKADESDLILAGFLTFMDPPKADAKETLAAISKLGVAIKVLSGDNPLVANNVCQQLGLDTSPSHTLTGDELFELTNDDEDPELRAIFQRTVVFARLNPSQKARVVGVLRDMGHTVGFMGDGINDTLAIREADVGISVDSGSDLAKDAADVILTEKNLSVIHSAIITGRRTHGNTVKYIYMAASSNFGNVFSLLVAAAWLPFLPMLPLHLLCQNLLYDFSQIALPFDNVDEEYIRLPKQWAIGSLKSFMFCIGPISSIFDITTFAICWWYYGYDNTADAERFQTCWFLIGIMTQLTIVHAIRSDRPFFDTKDKKGSRASIHVWCATLLLGGVALMLPNVPSIASLLSMTAPPDNFYGFMAAILVCYVTLTQVAKHFYIRAFKHWL